MIVSVNHITPDDEVRLRNLAINRRHGLTNLILSVVHTDNEYVVDLSTMRNDGWAYFSKDAQSIFNRLGGSFTLSPNGQVIDGFSVFNNR